MGVTLEELDRIFENFSEEEGFENTLLKYKILEVIRFVHGDSLLDIGCGLGFLSRALSSQVNKVVALDGSLAKIERARKINVAPNISYECTMFEDWTSIEPFDTIVATNVLEHVSDAGAFLERCREMLLPGGRFIATVPNALGLHKRIGMQMGLLQDYYALTAADKAKGHNRVYDRALLESEFKAAGFSIQHSGGILLKPLSHRQMESWDPKIVDALFVIGKELPDYCSSLLVVGQKNNR